MEIALLQEGLEVVQGKVAFPHFEKLKEEAILVAQKIDEMEVTEENVKETKKTLARVNRAVKALNDRRIQVKKTLLEPYDAFAEQVKEIETIVKTADERVRQQVRDMEEADREEKKEHLRDIFEKRLAMYEYAKVMSFDDWIHSGHLNKSSTLAANEKDMTETLEKWERDIKMLSDMPHSEDLIREYRESKDIVIAIEAVKSVLAEKEKQKEVLQEVTGKEEYLIKVFSKKDLKLAEMLLSENEIEFETL